MLPTMLPYRATYHAAYHAPYYATYHAAYHAPYYATYHAAYHAAYHGTAPSFPAQWVLGLRTAQPRLVWNFRTTDLDAISPAISPCSGALDLNLTSRSRTRR